MSNGDSLLNHSALYLASEMGHVGIIKDLIQRSADVNRATKVSYLSSIKCLIKWLL